MVSGRYGEVGRRVALFNLAPVRMSLPGVK